MFEGIKILNAGKPVEGLRQNENGEYILGGINVLKIYLENGAKYSENVEILENNSDVKISLIDSGGNEISIILLGLNEILLTNNDEVAVFEVFEGTETLASMTTIDDLEAAAAGPANLGQAQDGNPAGVGDLGATDSNDIALRLAGLAPGGPEDPLGPNVGNFIPVVEDVFIEVDEIQGEEGAGDKNIYNGQLTVFDADLEDAGLHTFAFVTGSLAVTSTSGVITLEDDDIELIINPDGSFTLSGDFNELAFGETATVTFDYTATDVEGDTSAPATVSFTVNGTNDIPIVGDIGIDVDVVGELVDLHEDGSFITAMLDYREISNDDTPTDGPSTLDLEINREYFISVQRYNSFGESDGEAIEISVSEAKVTNISIIALSDGGFSVNWLEYTEEGTVLRVEQYDEYEVLTQSTTIVVDELNDDPQYQVIELNDGTLAVAWKIDVEGESEEDFSGEQLLVQRIGIDSEPVVVSQDGDINNNYETFNIKQFELEPNGENGFSITWIARTNEVSDNDFGEENLRMEYGSSEKVYVQSFDADGNPTGDIIDIGVKGQRNFQPELNILETEFGTFSLVTWQSNRSFFGQLLDENGEIVGEMEGLIKSSQFTPDVAVLSDGRFVVTWNEQSYDKAPRGFTPFNEGRILSQIFEVDQRETEGGLEFFINNSLDEPVVVYDDTSRTGNSVVDTSIFDVRTTEDGGFNVVFFESNNMNYPNLMPVMIPQGRMRPGDGELDPLPEENNFHYFRFDSEGNLIYSMDPTIVYEEKDGNNEIRGALFAIDDDVTDTHDFEVVDTEIGEGEDSESVRYEVLHTEYEYIRDGMVYPWPNIGDDINHSPLPAPEDLSVDIVFNEESGQWEYILNGDFNYLAQGERAQITFQYRAIDDANDPGDPFEGDAINESSYSEPATITVTIIGTNDQPVVEKVTRGETLALDFAESNMPALGEGTGILSILGFEGDEQVDNVDTTANGLAVGGNFLNPNTDGTKESILFNFEEAHNSAIVTLSNFEGEDKALWESYDDEGNLLASGLLENGATFVIQTMEEFASLKIIGENGTFNVQSIEIGNILFEESDRRDPDSPEVTTLSGTLVVSEDVDLHDTHVFDLYSMNNYSQPPSDGPMGMYPMPTEYMPSSIYHSYQSIDFLKFSIARPTNIRNLQVLIESDDLDIEDGETITLDEIRFIGNGALDREVDYELTGNFDALGAGEQATVTLKYYADDKSIWRADENNESPRSEPQYIHLTVTGTNDQPVVKQIDVKIFDINNTDGLEVSAYAMDGNTKHDLGNIDENDGIGAVLVDGGWGVQNSLNDGDSEIDGSGWNDTIVFTFNDILPGAIVELGNFGNNEQALWKAFDALGNEIASGEKYGPNDFIRIDGNGDEIKSIEITARWRNSDFIVKSIKPTFFETYDEDYNRNTLDDVQTTLSGVLQVEDADVNDTHQFNLVDIDGGTHTVDDYRDGYVNGLPDGSIDVKVVSSDLSDVSDITIDSIRLSSNQNEGDHQANFEIKGNFNALGAGETATLTFKYYATDDSTFQTPGESADSEYKTVSITVTGTNDQPIVNNVVLGTAPIIMETFENGAIGWSNNKTENGGELTNFLGRFGGSTGIVSKEFDFGESYANQMVKIEFDMYEIDSWDGIGTGNSGPLGDAFQVYINNQNVSTDVMSFDDRNPYFEDNGIETRSNEFTGWGPEDIHHYVLEVRLDEDGKIKLGFASTTTQSIRDESWGIDNLKIDPTIYESSDPDYDNNTLDDRTTLLTGTLFAHDLDVNDTHRFSVRDIERGLRTHEVDYNNGHNSNPNSDRWVQVTSTDLNDVQDIRLDSLILLNNDRGGDNKVDFEIVGDFNALGAGEKVTITFKYKAEDDSSFRHPGEDDDSEYKTVSIIVTGTNDQPVVENVNANVSIYNVDNSNGIDIYAYRVSGSDRYSRTLTDNEGWGVKSYNSDNSQLDGYYDESLLFDFTTPVKDAVIELMQFSSGERVSWKAVMTDGSSITGTKYGPNDFINIDGNGKIIDSVEIIARNNGTGLRVKEITTSNFIFETSDPDYDKNTLDDVKTRLTGTLEVTEDLDVNDTHIFRTMNLSVASDAINANLITLDGITLTNNTYNDGDPHSANFEITGDFNALAAGETAVVTFQYRAEDDSSSQNPGESQYSEWKTVSITVTGTNDQPILNSVTTDTPIIETDLQGLPFTQDASYPEHSYLIGQLTPDISDKDDTDLHEFVSFGIQNVYETLDSNGVITGPTKVRLDSAGEFRLFNPDFNKLGIDEEVTVRFEVQVTDNENDPNGESSVSEAKMVEVVIKGTNDQPSVQAVNVSTSEAPLSVDTTVSGTFLGHDEDTNDNPNLTYHVTSEDENGTSVGVLSGAGFVVVNDVLYDDDGNGSLVYNGINFMGTNGGYESTVNIAVKYPSEITDPSLIKIRGISVDGDTFDLVGDFNALPEGKVLEVKFLYNTDDHTIARDSNDETNISDSAMVTLTITGTNDVPTISYDLGSDILGQVQEDNSLGQIAYGDLNITDLDVGENMFKDFIDNSSPYGTFSVGTNGSWSYSLDNAAAQILGHLEVITETYRVWSKDETKYEDVTIKIHGENDAPEITSTVHSATVTENEVIATTVDETTVLVDIDATDVDNTSLTYSITSGNSKGYFIIDPTNGEISLTLAGKVDIAASKVNDETFDLGIKVTDGLLEANTVATIIIDDDFVDIPEIDLPSLQDSGDVTIDSSYNSDNLTNESKPVFDLLNIADDAVQIIIKDDSSNILAKANALRLADGSWDWSIDNNGTGELAYDGTKWTFTPDSALADGSYTFNILVQDDAGNVQNNNLSVVIDTIPPTIDTNSLITSINETLTNLDLGQITTSDANGPVTLSVSGTGFSLDSSGNLTYTGEFNYEDNSSHTATITATDAAGNVTTEDVVLNVNNVYATVTTTTRGGYNEFNDFHQVANNGLHGWSITNAFQAPNGLGFFDASTHFANKTYTLTNSSGLTGTLTFALSVEQFIDNDTFVVELTDGSGNIIKVNDSHFGISDANSAVYNVDDTNPLLTTIYNIDLTFTVPADEVVNVKFSTPTIETWTQIGDNYAEVQTVRMTTETLEHKVITFNEDEEINMVTLLDQANDFSETPSAIDEINLTVGDHILSNISVTDVLAITDINNTLKIIGDANDKVDLDLALDVSNNVENVDSSNASNIPLADKWYRDSNLDDTVNGYEAFVGKDSSDNVVKLLIDQDTTSVI